MPLDLHCCLAAGAALGESPMWSVDEQVLYWIDMGIWQQPQSGPSPSLNRYDPRTGNNISWLLAEPIGAYALRVQRGAILALRSGLHDFDFTSRRLCKLAAAPAGGEHLRFNDGRCDRQGRFWVGQAQTITAGIENGQGSWYRYDGIELSAQIDGVSIANGLAFSPDGRTMYAADVIGRVVHAYDYDAERGIAGGRRRFAEFEPGVVPDGATVDAEGGYWIALYGAGKIARFLPDGRLDREIPLPVKNPTMLAFGGAALDTLYITSASHRLSDDERRRQPEAGGLFCCKPGVVGLPESLYRGAV